MDGALRALTAVVKKMKVRNPYEEGLYSSRVREEEAEETVVGRRGTYDLNQGTLRG